MAKSQKDQVEDIQSVKSNTQQLVFNKKKNIPLPELNRDRKKLNLRPNPDTKPNSYVDKQVRQQDIIALKNSNNLLSNQNVRLKTRNSQLQKQIQRLEKIQEDGQKGKSKPKSDITSLKTVLRNKDKQLEDLKKQNAKIKTSVKFTTVNQLEVQRNNIIEETARLRQMLQYQQSRIISTKISTHQGMNGLQQKLILLQKRNQLLIKQNTFLKYKASQPNSQYVEKQTHLVDKTSAINKTSQVSVDKTNLSQSNSSHSTNIPNNPRRTRRDRQKQLVVTRAQPTVKPQKQSQHSKTDKIPEQSQSQHRQESRSMRNSKQKRNMSRSAQKYRPSIPTDKTQCQSCKLLKSQNKRLIQQIQLLKDKIQKLTQQITKKPNQKQQCPPPPLTSPPPLTKTQVHKSPVAVPTQQQISAVRRFIIYRLKAHHVSMQQACFHLLGPIQQAPKQVDVQQIIQVAMTQPFSLLTDRYVQTFICRLFCPTLIGKQKQFQINPNITVNRKQLQQIFQQYIGPLQLLQPHKQQQMFIQIAQLVTHYQQHVMKGLLAHRNSQNTISQAYFRSFFIQIQLQPEYVQFMICQIVLQSLDLQHLNFYNLLQIFYIAPQPKRRPIPLTNSIVKEEPEEFQESHSFMVAQSFANKNGKSQQEMYESGFEEEQEAKIKVTDLEYQEQVQDYIEEDSKVVEEKKEKGVQLPVKQVIQAEQEYPFDQSGK